MPNIEPSPPKIDVPPMTTAAMTLRFVSDCPAIVVVPNWARARTAPESGEHSHHCVNHDQMALDMDTDPAGGLLVGSDGVGVAAELGLV